MKVVVGLGNPGRQYAGTRHNVGYEVIDYLAAAPSIGLFRNQFQSQIAEASEAGEKVLYVKPETFMNLSGRAVRAILDFYKVPVENLLVICDDYNLPTGKLRGRSKGSHGGQNGLRNIQEQLGTDAYPRLRIGVGQPGPGEAVDHVLSRFRPAERAQIDEAIAQASQAVLTWIRSGIDACMNQVNGPGEKAQEKRRSARPEKPRNQPEADPAKESQETKPRIEP